ncbi:MAG: sulfatase [Candidatus Hydrogenedentes bacterium]|nr:sulfatase [Candidatus Hydrogenedentota bacterium]
MTSPAAETTTTRRSDFWHGLLIILSLSISLGIIDVGLALAYKPAVLDSLANLLLPATTTMVCVLALGLCSALFLMLTAVIMRVHTYVLLKCLTVFYALLFILAWLSNAIQVEIYAARPNEAWTRLTVILLVSASVGLAVLPRRNEDNLNWTANAFPLAALPVLCSLAVYWLSIALERPIPPASGMINPWSITAVHVVILMLVVLWRRARFQVLVLLLVMALMLVGATVAIKKLYEPRSVTPVGTNTQRRVSHVVLITIDTLRRDSLGSYGSARRDTPNLDAFATECVQFMQAYSPGPWTLPSVASIMTGVTPDVHRSTTRFARLSANFTTLAEFLREAGYRTSGIGYNVFLTENMRMDQGFVDYDFYPKPGISDPRTFGGRVLRRLFLNRYFPRKASSEDLTNLARRWLESHRDEDFFFWLHYFDPHMPYEPPANFVPKEDPLVAKLGRQFGDKDGARIGHFGLTLEERQWARTLYDAEVRYVDQCVGRVIESLRTLGIYDDALIVLTTDHGEEFWEHDNFEHGHTLFNELIWAPLLVKLPGHVNTGPRQALVTTTALLPTILDFCGIPYDPTRFSHPSFAPVLTDSTASIQVSPVYSSGLMRYENQESAVWGQYKYIRNQFTNREQLYNLLDDPKEKNTLSRSSPEILEQGRLFLREHNLTADRLRHLYKVDEQRPLDQLPEATVEELESLGYI